MESRSTQPSCPFCSKTLMEGAEFCAFCGAKIIPSSTRSSIDAYVQKRIAFELEERLKDQKTLVREIGDEAEDIVWKRLKGYAVISGTLMAFILALIAFFGIKTFEDLSKQIEPVVKAAEQRALAAKKTIDEAADKIAGLKTTLDQLSQDVDAQTKRVTEKSNAIREQFDSLDAAAEDARQKWTAYQGRAERLSSQLDAMGKSLETKVTQVSKQVDDLTVRQAYPTLGQQKYVTLQGNKWRDKSEKGTSERWINIWIDPGAFGDVAPTRFTDLVKDLKEIGYTSLLGFLGIGGPYSSGYGPANTIGQTSLSYFEHDLKEEAAEIAKLVSRDLSITIPEPQYVDPSKLTPEDKRFIYENAALDMQLHIGGR